MRATAAADLHETGVQTFVIVVGGAVLLACLIGVLSLIFIVVRGFVDQLGGLGPGPFLTLFGLAGAVAGCATAAATGNVTTALVVAVLGGLVVTFVVSLLVD